MNVGHEIENEQISLLKTVNELHQKNVSRPISVFFLLATREYFCRLIIIKMTSFVLFILNFFRN